MTQEPTRIAEFNLRDYGSLLLTRDQGEPVRAALMAVLQRNDRVEIGLDGVEAYTPSFMDEVLGKCLVEIGTDRFRRDIKLIASAPGIRKLVNLVLSNRTAGRSKAAGGS